MFTITPTIYRSTIIYVHLKAYDTLSNLPWLLPLVEPPIHPSIHTYISLAGSLFGRPRPRPSTVAGGVGGSRAYDGILHFPISKFRERCISKRSRGSCSAPSQVCPSLSKSILYSINHLIWWVIDVIVFASCSLRYRIYTLPIYYHQQP